MIIKIIFIAFVLIHGLIHTLGFLKAFNLSNISQLTKDISKPAGIIWLLVSVLFFLTILFIIFNNNVWMIIGFISVILSQILIISSWQDAKFGTIANLIILTGIILNFASYKFEKSYTSDVINLIKENEIKNPYILTKQDIQHLPVIVQKYLEYTNVINKPKINNFKVVLKGQIRSRGKDFFDFTSEQYNFVNEHARLFFMKGKMYGLNVPGYHKYINGTASMDVKLFGMFSVIKAEGEVMNKAETVTLFNDMCLFAPSSLIDNRIEWESVNDTCVNAIFSNKGIKISALLLFNNSGRLINFISNDRYDISDMQQYPFLTPIYEYKNFDGINVASQSDAIWKYPDVEFVYAKFDLQEIKYNLLDY